LTVEGRAAVVGNTAGNVGGGIANFADASPLSQARAVVQDDAKVTNNLAATAGDGVANVVSGGASAVASVTVTGRSLVADNGSPSGASVGGGILNTTFQDGGYAHVIVGGHSRIRANRARYGAGIDNNSSGPGVADLVVREWAQVESNLATDRSGGGIMSTLTVGAASVTLAQHAAVLDNHSQGSGGGIWNVAPSVLVGADSVRVRNNVPDDCGDSACIPRPA
jgi:hypothetical protein